MKSLKNILIILVMFLSLFQTSFAYEKVYLQNPAPSYYRYNMMNNLPYRRNYISPYQYRTYNHNDAQKLRRYRTLRKLNRLQRNYNNFLSFNNPFNSKGTLTGYSVPVSDDEDIYYDYNSGKKVKNKNNNYIEKQPSKATMELFSLPAMDNSSYSSKGQRNTDTGGIGGKTGVTIIWD